jgi:hypothetical protein
LDKDTTSAIVSLESSFGFTVEVKFTKDPKFPYSWSITNKDDWRFFHCGTEMTKKSTRTEMEYATENILKDLGETKKSIVMKSRLRGGK